MSKRRYLALALLPLLAVPFLRTAPTSHGVVAAPLGVARTSAELDAVIDAPGPVTVESVVGADWEVPRSGLLNLDHPEAKKAGLKDGPEPIVVPLHAIRHPQRGLFLVDTGVERALRDDPKHAALSGVAARFLGVDKMKVRTDTASYLAGQKVSGVFLTHLHLDHVSGLRDVPNDTPVFVGPGEATDKSLMHFVVRGYTDAALAGKGALNEWQFGSDGVLDVFGDGSVWAIHVPGHTAGSTAYLARTTTGPVLMVGDACHTTWGWEHGVEPGTYSEDQPRSASSLARLRALVAKHPRITVRVGHQGLEAQNLAGR